MRILRNTLAAVVCLALLWLSALPAGAVPSVDSSQKIHDFAGLFTQEEENNLEECAARLLAEYGMDLVVVTTGDNEGLAPRAYADNFFGGNGFGAGAGGDGALLIIDMNDREAGIYTFGGALDYLDSAIIDDMLDNIYPYLTDGDYYSAGTYFYSEAQSQFDYGRASLGGEDPVGAAAEGDGPPAASASQTSISNVLGALFHAAIPALVLSLIVVAILYIWHRKSMSAPPGAQQYLAGGVNVTAQSDVFLHTHTTAVPIPKNNDTGGGGAHRTSGGGRSNGGGSRKF